LISDLVPDLSRAIYLDADLLVMRDIRELWSVATAGHLVSAVPEYNDLLFSARSTLSWPMQLGVNLCLRDRMQFQAGRSWTTFNSGVLVLELALIRRQVPDLSQRLLAEARELMAAHEGAPVFFLDQDILSKHLHDRINALPDEWNFHDFLPRLVMDHAAYRHAMLRAKIMHYNGPPRPWEPAGRWRPYTKSWYRCLDQTPWAGWRPSYRRGRLPRASGRPVRTAIGGVIVVLGRFRNHFFAEQNAHGLFTAPESS
jgi:lipopolysaccharide biosynthesis glycosyltransferase